MNELNIFAYEENMVRTRLDEQGGIWFVAKDVARALGYSDFSNPARLFQSVPEEWKGVNPIHTLGGKQEMLTLTEQGLYFFVARSDKPAALPFQKWLAGEVLPSLRKTGSYSLPHATEYVQGNNGDFALPENIQSLSEKTRMRCLELAIARANKLEGADHRILFIEFCQMVGEQNKKFADADFGIVQDFYKEACLNDDNGRIQSTPLYKSFLSWYAAKYGDSDTAMSQKRFSTNMLGLGYVRRVQSNPRIIFGGLYVRPEFLQTL